MQKGAAQRKKGQLSPFEKAVLFKRISGSGRTPCLSLCTKALVCRLWQQDAEMCIRDRPIAYCKVLSDEPESNYPFVPLLIGIFLCAAG